MGDVACPKCNEVMQIDIAGAVGKDQKFSYRVYPELGSMMQAKAIGGQLTAMDNLMRACAVQDGGKVRTYIDRIETHDDGSLEFFLIVLPVVAWDAEKGKFVRSAPAVRKDAPETHPEPPLQG